MYENFEPKIIFHATVGWFVRSFVGERLQEPLVVSLTWSRFEDESQGFLLVLRTIMVPRHQQSLSIGGQSRLPIADCIEVNSRR